MLLNRSVALIGFMGCGKTTVANHLIRLFSVCGFAPALIDVDAEIEQATKMPLAMIFSKHGEGHFRDLEYDFYQNLSPELTGQAIIATGGGVVTNPQNIAALRQRATIYYLSATPAKIMKNLDGDTSRPLLPTCSIRRLEVVTAMLASREPLYRQAADHIIDTDALSTLQIAEKIHEIHTTSIISR